MDDEPSPNTVELLADFPTSSSSKYEIVGLMAKGGYAEVFKVHLKENKSFGYLALKRTRHDSIRGLITNIDYAEIRALRLLEHEDNFVKMIDIIRGHNEFGIVLELCKADLRKVLHNKNIKLSLPDIKNMLKQLFTGIKAMHRLRIMHRDLKPANILLSITGIVKISDLGSSAVLGRRSQYTVKVCTLWYKSPELLFGHKKYDETTDLWSAGLTAVEFWSREPALFNGVNQIDQMEEISKVCGFCSNEIWPGANEFPRYEEFSKKLKKYKANKLESRLKKIIKNDAVALAFVAKFLKLYPGDRMTAAEALEDTFFTSDPEPSVDLYQVINSIKGYW